MRNRLFSKQLYPLTQPSMDFILKHEELLIDKIATTSPSSKRDSTSKLEESTATKIRTSQLSEHQHIRIRNQLFAMFIHPTLKGKIKVQDFDNLSDVEVTLYHKIQNQTVQQNVRIIFPCEYPTSPPKLQIHSCNLAASHPDYSIPKFMSHNELLAEERWNQQIQLADVIAAVMINLEGFHASEVERLLTSIKQGEDEDGQGDRQISKSKEEQNSLERQVRKHRRKSSNMTGCADKQLTETKNLNRHFRSKLREVLRDLSITTGQFNENYQAIDLIFTPNRVGFEDIRRALNNKWFNAAVRRQMSSGQFLHKILRGMMGIKSKKLMIKYYHVMVSAVEEPNSFTRWKYD